MNRLAFIGECMVELSEAPDGTLTRRFGGDTLNTALYAARLGLQSDYVTALGDDPFSDEMLAAWAREGIGTALIPRLPGRLPGLYLIRTSHAGERQFHYWRNEAPVRQLFHLPQTAGIERALAASSLIYLSGITLSLFDPASRDQLFHLLARARAQGARIAFDTNFRPRGWPDRALAQAAYAEAFRHSHLVFASTEDLALLHDEPGPDSILARLQASGVEEAVIKLPTPACTVTHEGRTQRIEAAPVPAILDTTAAGDSFAAAYLAARAAGHAPAQAARAGHHLAGIVVQHRGAIIPAASMPQTLLPPEPP